MRNDEEDLPEEFEEDGLVDDGDDGPDKISDPEDLDPDVDDLVVDPDLDDVDDDEDFSVEIDDDDDEDDDEDGPAPTVPTTAPDDDDDDEPDPDDVEEDLDTILKDRIASGDDDDDDDDEDAPTKPEAAAQDVEQRKDNEWVCQSCFLILSRTQFASSDSTYCKDCEANM